MTSNHHEPKTVQQYLKEDAPDLADELEPMLDKMRNWDTPQGDRARKAHLSTLLIQQHRAIHARRRFDLREWWPALLILSQLRVVEAHIWTATALVMALGGIVTLVLDPYASRDGLSFALIAPIIAAGGVAFLYEPENQSVMEIERGTPASIRLIWLARITLVFSFNMLLGMVASMLIGLIHPSISVWSLVMMWLAPMALLSALAFLISIYRGEPILGVLISMLLWIVQVLKHLLPQGVSWVDHVPNLLAVEARLWTFAVALLLLGAGIWTVGRVTDRTTLSTD